MPNLPNKNRSKNEKYIANNRIVRGDLVESLKNNKLAVKSFEGLGYTIADLLEMAEAPASHINEKSIRVFKDQKKKYVNIANGHRLTIGNPKNPKRTIYMVGGCKIFGTFSPDRGTIASHLQHAINTQCRNRGISVENHGIFAVSRRDDFFNILNTLPVQENDIVIIDSNTKSPYYNHLDLGELLQRPHDYGEVFSDINQPRKDKPIKGHMTENGNHAVANALFDYLQGNDFLSNFKREQKETPPPITPPEMFGIPSSSFSCDNLIESFDNKYANELTKYKDALSQTHAKKFGRIGAIVMSCNPFTLGHRYLIEYAARRVNHLYIFAVEEDKSVFPFADRFKLIKAGTAEFSNVTVLPSGKFIISNLTFQDYFNKAEIQDQSIDPSMDVTLFAKEIAPTMNITIRFVGEEPLDKVTKQYNDTLRRILPKYGIDFIEIPRKESNGQVISASRVRKLLEDNQFDEIAKIVPKTTLQYLKKFKAA